MLKFELFSFQIISSICEFVESCTPEIRSGWRPLFGALRCVRPPSALPSPSVPGGLPGMDLLNYDYLKFCISDLLCFNLDLLLLRK